MVEEFFEVEQDGAGALTPSNYERNKELIDAGKGAVVVRLPDGLQHTVTGHRSLTQGVGYRITTAGTLEIVLNHEDRPLRIYGSWLWVEGSPWEKRPGRAWVG